MNFFLVSEDVKEEDVLTEKYKKKITQCVKSNTINLLEHSYLMDYINNGGSIVNASWFVALINKINDDELKDIVIKRMGKIFCKKGQDLMINDDLTRELIDEKAKIIKFTSDQDDAISQICKFIPDYNSRKFGLYGYAGTGKTTTIVELITYLIKHKIVRSIVFTAPTNQAVVVIESKFRPYLRELYSTYFNKDLDDDFDTEEIIDKMYNIGIKIEFTTIHKLLKFESDYSMDGDMIFVRGKKESLINQYELIIIDECSMIPVNITDLIFNEIRMGIKSNNYKKVPKVIFCGDPAQLSPVKEKSIIFAKSMNDLSLKDYVSCIQGDETTKDIEIFRNRYTNLMNDIIDMPTITLKKVMRSNKQGIVLCCYQIRLWVMNEVKKPDLSVCIGKEGVWFDQFKKNDDKIKTEWFEKFVKYCKSGNNCNIIITWTVDQALKYNQKIRSILFEKDNLDRFEKNDILKLNNYYNFSNDTQDYFSENKFYTSEQVKVVELELITKTIDTFPITLTKGALKLKNGKIYEIKYKSIIDILNKMTNRSFLCWKLFVTKITNKSKDNYNTNVLYVIHETAENELTNEKRLVAEHIKKLRIALTNKFKDKSDQINEHVIKPMWLLWHKRYVEPFANVSYGYAITCHKGQGSNFYNVFVDAVDIGKMYDINEMKKCLYTAISRASNELNLLWPV